MLQGPIHAKTGLPWVSEFPARLCSGKFNPSDHSTGFRPLVLGQVVSICARLRQQLWDDHMTKHHSLNRRRFMATTAGSALLVGALGTSRALAADPIKTAGIYNVPVEQQ